MPPFTNTYWLNNTLNATLNAILNAISKSVKMKTSFLAVCAVKIGLSEKPGNAQLSCCRRLCKFLACLSNAAQSHRCARHTVAFED